MLACKQSEPFGPVVTPFWHRLPVWPVLARFDSLWPALARLPRFGLLWPACPALARYGPLGPSWAPFGPFWPAWPCFSISGYFKVPSSQYLNGPYHQNPEVLTVTEYRISRNIVCEKKHMYWINSSHVFIFRYIVWPAATRTRKRKK